MKAFFSGKLLSLLNAMFYIGASLLLCSIHLHPFISEEAPMGQPYGRLILMEKYFSRLPWSADTNTYTPFRRIHSSHLD
jgi:hypothetical protein